MKESERGLPPRRAALLVLRGVRAGRPFDDALDEAITALSDPDRRLVHEVAAGVLRSRTELDGLLAPRVTGGWRQVADDTKDLLRLGAYQLRHLDRVPAHAAVAATVELAKREHGPKLAGFVNAVLRRLAREGDAPQPEAAPPPGAPAAGTARDLATRASHPPWLVTRWIRQFGAEATNRLLEHNNRRPPLQIQPARWSLERLRAALSEAGVAHDEHPERPGIAIRGTPVAELPGFGEGGFVVQDAAQALALGFVGATDGALVWDPCAAPGGKCAVLAQRCRVVASDVRAKRMPRLVDTVRRAAPAVRLLRADALAAPFRPATFDAVVLDAPCTATGTLARHPDGRWQLHERRIARLATVQAALLDAVAPTVVPGGVLAYMTCSLEREENQDQVEAFLSRHPEFARTADDLLIFPPDRGTDGAFASRMVRAA